LHIGSFTMADKQWLLMHGDQLLKSGADNRGHFLWSSWRWAGVGPVGDGVGGVGTTVANGDCL